MDEYEPVELRVVACGSYRSGDAGLRTDDVDFDRAVNQRDPNIHAPLTVLNASTPSD
jgi:hypothetical protein